VRELWIVDPAREQVEVFDLTADPNAPMATYLNKQRVKSRVLPKLAIPSAAIFRL
jgi:Uma2 family endonuclease